MKFANLVYRIQEIIASSALLAWQVFKTGMRLGDACLLCAGDNRARLEGAIDLVASSEETYLQLSENGSRIKDFITGHSWLAVKILGTMGIEESEESLENRVDELCTAGRIELVAQINIVQQVIHTDFDSECILAKRSVRFESPDLLDESEMLNVPKYPPYGGQFHQELDGSSITITEEKREEGLTAMNGFHEEGEENFNTLLFTEKKKSKNTLLSISKNILSKFF